MAESRMPVLFIGHGSPMHALANNALTQTWQKWGRELPRPKAIVCISAHWMTEGTWVTGMQAPRTIHDFFGFPQPLFDIQYPTPGWPELARDMARTISAPKIQIDDQEWGLDHGTWAVLRHMYPKADIPVLQLSLNMREQAPFHLQLGEKLKWLREQGVLIIGSGNSVHNLRKLNWDESSSPYDWAVDFDRWTTERVMSRDFSSIANGYLKSPGGPLSVPTPDHFYPLFYVLGASHSDESIAFANEIFEMGSLSMRCVTFGLAEALGSVIKSKS